MSVNTTRLQVCLDQLRAGDPAAREALLALSLERLRLFTGRMLGQFPKVGRWEETDDVLQNVYFRLDRLLRDLPIDSARDFLCLAATNVRREIIDLARHYGGPHGHGKHYVTPPDPGGGTFALAQATSCDQALLAAWSQLHCTIGALPDRERETFDLHWYQGLTLEETAGVVGVSVGEVKRRWRSARLLLAEAIGGESPFFL